MVSGYTRWICLLSLLLGCSAWGGEIALVTSLSGKVVLVEDSGKGQDLQAFTKLRDGDRLVLEPSSRLQLVYFRNARQETWSGPASLEIGVASGKTVNGKGQPEVKTLPQILVKQITKTPSFGSATSKTGMIRMRSAQNAVQEDIERTYSDLRAKLPPGDIGPEMYLLAAYFERREFTKLLAFGQKVRTDDPGNGDLTLLLSMYSRAIEQAEQEPMDNASR